MKVQVKALVLHLCLTLCDPRTVARQVSLPTEFFRQEYWSGQLFPSPGSLPDPGMGPGSPARQASSLPSEPPGKPHPLCMLTHCRHHALSCHIHTCFLVTYTRAGSHGLYQPMRVLILLETWFSEFKGVLGCHSFFHNLTFNRKIDES